MQVTINMQHALYACLVLSLALTPMCVSEEQDQVCRVSDVHVEENFDIEAFSGAWYVASDTGLFSCQRTFDAVFYMIQDLKYYFHPKEDGNYKLITSARSFLLCNSAVGVAQVDSSNPAKMLVSYPGAWASRMSEPKPFWVVSTDYKEYAIIYSCRQVNEDGSCHPDHQVALTLSRSQYGHSEESTAIISGFFEELCIKESQFKLMPHSRPCPDIKPEDYADQTPKAAAPESTDDAKVEEEL